MTDNPIKTRRDGAILEVTLDRPKANAIDLQTSRKMGEVFASFRDDPDLRVAIITGEGGKFSKRPRTATPLMAIMALGGLAAFRKCAILTNRLLQRLTASHVAGVWNWR